jgi:putative transposase
MKYDPDRHHRRSIRLRDYDYSQAGAYFVTICTQNRAYLFGAVMDGEMQLNNAGEIAKAVWNRLPATFPSVRVDAFVVMPNHIHGIVTVGAQFIAPGTIPPPPVGAQFIVPSNPGVMKEGAMNHAPTLGNIVRMYKAASARLIRQAGIPEFAWQRNYYEHIVRNDESLDRIRQYVLENPTRWEFDRENPAAKTPEPEDAWRI